MENISQNPILADEEASISSPNGSTSSKKWKKSTFIFGGIMGLVVLIPIVFSIFNVVENSNLKQENSRLEAKLESEVEKSTQIMEANLNKIQSQLELEIKTREQENETLSVAIERIKSFVHYTEPDCGDLNEHVKNLNKWERDYEWIEKSRSIKTTTLKGCGKARLGPIRGQFGDDDVVKVYLQKQLDDLKLEILTKIEFDFNDGDILVLVAPKHSEFSRVNFTVVSCCEKTE